MKSAIYKIENLKNGMFYIGGTSRPSFRWTQHKSALSLGKHGNKRLQKDWAEHGAESFSFSVIEKVDDKESIFEREQFWIDTLKAAEVGYNVSFKAKGRAGVKHTEESIRLMSERHKGKEISQATRDKLSAAMKNREFSEEWRAKISAAKTGKKRAPMSDEARERMSNSRIGKHHSDETKLKLSAIHTGKKMSEESRRKMSESQRKRFARDRDEK